MESEDTTGTTSISCAAPGDGASSDVERLTRKISPASEAILSRSENLESEGTSLHKNMHKQQHANSQENGTIGAGVQAKEAGREGSPPEQAKEAGREGSPPEKASRTKGFDKGRLGGFDDPTEAVDEAEDEFAWGAPKHIFVLSSAGKPVFSLWGDEQRLSTLMGLIQGVLSLCADCGEDEMESISAGSRRFVFLKRDNLVLVAVSYVPAAPSLSDTPPLLGVGSSDGDGFAPAEDAGETDRQEEEEAPECESFLRLQLEYMYASILFLLTSKVQGIFKRSPGYDLRGLLGGADTSLKGVIDLAEPSRGRGRMLAGGVETVWMDPAIRTRVTRALQAAQTATGPNALYALWLCGEKLVSLAQPRAPSHRLHSRDLLLLVNFVATQPALRNAESWTPVCFPRFQEKGYLYAYIAFLEDPPVPRPAKSGADDVTERIVGSGGGNGDIAQDTNDGELSKPGGDSCVILVSVEASSEQFQGFRRTRAALESRFRSALGVHWDRYLGVGAAIERQAILTRFCTQMKALHFYYCLRGRHGGAPCVTQCLSSPFADPLKDNSAAQRRIWGHYTRSALRLRRGSCQEGRVSSRAGKEERLVSDMGHGGSTPSGQQGSPKAGGGGGGGGFDEATALFESDPVHSLAYEIGAKVTVISLFGQRDNSSGGGRWTSSASGVGSWGDRDELHACFPSSIAPEAAYKAAIRLAAIIRRDREWLFLTGTGATK